MKKSKGQSKKAVKKSGKPAKKSGSKSTRKTKAVDIVKVRQSISNIVGKEAEKITKAVVGVAEAGQLASAKYLFEVAGVYPTTEEPAGEAGEEESLAKILLDRIGPEPGPLPGDIESDGDGEEVLRRPAPAAEEGEREGDPELVDCKE